MTTLTAKELKNRTGEALRAIGRRERVLITRRGRPYAVLLPVEDAPEEPGEAVERLREEIRADARRHPPPFATPEEMLVLCAAEECRPRPRALVTWNPRHFAGRTQLLVRTPQQVLRGT